MGVGVGTARVEPVVNSTNEYVRPATSGKGTLPLVQVSVLPDCAAGPEIVFHPVPALPGSNTATYEPAALGGTVPGGNAIANDGVLGQVTVTSGVTVK